MDDNFVEVITEALSYYKVKVTRSSINEYLSSHPHYSSFKSICDALRKWEIEHYPLRLNIKEMKELRAPFLIHMKDSGGTIAFVYKLNEAKVFYTADGKRKIKVSVSDFFEKTTGAVIVLNPDKKSKENGYRQKYHNEILYSRILPLSALIILPIILLREFDQPHNTLWWTLVLAKLIGLISSLILILKEFKVNNSVVDKICHFNSRTDCDKIINSNASKLFGWIGWADIGLIYFVVTLLYLFILPDRASNYSILALCILLASPYPLFSVFYQAFISKKWCPFCIVVQIILAVEFVVLLPSFKGIAINIKGLYDFLVIVLITTTIVFYLKAYYLKVKDYSELALEYRKTKRDPQIFTYLLKMNGYVNISINENSLVFGPANAPVTVVAFLSLKCSHCYSAFKKLIALFETSSEIKLVLIFPYDTNPEERHFFDIIYSQLFLNQPKNAIKILSSWYSDPKSLKEKIREFDNLSVIPEISDKIMDNNVKLSRECKIMGTPTVFINGYMLPTIYQPDDIEMFIYDIVKNSSAKNKHEAEVLS